MNRRRAVWMPCPGTGEPVRRDYAALSTRQVGQCEQCNAWVYLTIDGRIPAHDRAEWETA